MLNSTVAVGTTLDDTASNFTYEPGWDSSLNSFSIQYFNQTMQ
jgi:hypothetical protein